MVNIYNAKEKVLGCISRIKRTESNGETTLVIKNDDVDTLVEFLEFVVEELDKMPSSTTTYVAPSKEPGILKEIVGLFW